MINIKKYFKLILFTMFPLFFHNDLYSLETLGGLPAVNVESNPDGGTTYSLSLQILLLMSLCFGYYCYFVLCNYALIISPNSACTEGFSRCCFRGAHEPAAAAPTLPASVFYGNYHTK